MKFDRLMMFGRHLRRSSLDKMAENEKVILLLGEIKSGKTTFINSLFNYVKHDDMKTEDVEIPIGIHLSLIHPDTYLIETVSLGAEEDLDNEKDESGHSATQDPRVYKLEYENCNYVIIDTPGIGDCEGMEKDEISMKKIIDCVALYKDTIHVCIVIDANCFNTSIEYLFNIIFSYFKDISSYNFIFCFTKTRRTGYSVGDNFTFIKQTLPSNIQDKLNPKSIFCVDNEGMKHALILSCPDIDGDYKNDLKTFEKEARESWRKSTKETKRLLTTVAHQGIALTVPSTISNSNNNNVHMPHAMTHRRCKKIHTTMPPQSKLNPKKKILNFLLIGQRGSGKTTFINAIANYFLRKDFNYVVEHPKIVIPCSFDIYNSDINNMVKVTAETNVARNSFHADVDQWRVDTSIDKNFTQSTHSYIIDVGSHYLRIIDTPGLADVRGIDQDKRNLSSLFAYISQFSEIHGIGIVIGQDLARSAPALTFTIATILENFHKDAMKNFMLMFNNLYGSNFRPNDILTPLKQIFKELKVDEDVFKFNKSTIFCFDNLAFRYIAAQNQNQDLMANERPAAEKCFVHSQQEARRWIDLLKGKEPHKTADSLCVNRCRLACLHLQEPVANLISMIARNIRSLEKQGTINGVRFEKLDHPVTVCHKCKVNMGGLEVNRECHKRCDLKEVPMDIINNVLLQKCSALDQNIDKCRECKCSWKYHKHINYRWIEEPNVEKPAENRIANMLSLLTKKEEYENDLNKLQLSVTFMMAFLKRFSIVRFHDTHRAHIFMMVQQAKKESSAENVQRLEKVMKEHDEKMKKFGEDMDNNQMTDETTPSQILRLIDELKNYKHYGVLLTNVLDAEMDMMKQTEAHILEVDVIVL